MRIEFASPYEYWQKVCDNPAGRLFVPTGNVHHIGERFQLEAGVRGRSGIARLSGVVVGRRLPLGRMPAGVFLRLAPAEVQRARALLGIGASVPEFDRLRSSPRFRCSMPLRFLNPPLSTTSTVMNISEGGLLASRGNGLMEGEQVEVQMELPGGPLQLEAEVEWLMGSAAGLRFLRLSAEAIDRLGAFITQLRTEASAARAPKSEPVLVVADRDPDAASQLAGLLAEQGGRTLSVQDGRELVSLCRAVHPDLVFLDLLLEGIDGTQACRQLRSEQEVADTPLVLTAQLPPAELERLALDEGANDFLTKPAQQHQVAELLRRLFGVAGATAPALRM